MEVKEEVLKFLENAVKDPNTSWGSLAIYLANFWIKHPEAESLHSYVEWLEEYRPDWREQYWDWFYGFPANGNTPEAVAKFIASWFDLDDEQEREEARKFFHSLPLKEWGMEDLTFERILKMWEDAEL